VASAQIAESNLLAIHERFRSSVSRRSELSMLWWIYTGLLAVFVDTRDETQAKAERAYEWLVQRCGKLESPKGHIFGAVTLNSIPHWRDYHQRAADLAMELTMRVPVS
jgi:hypothetical protein